MCHSASCRALAHLFHKRLVKFSGPKLLVKNVGEIDPIGSRWMVLRCIFSSSDLKFEGHIFNGTLRGINRTCIHFQQRNDKTAIISHRSFSYTGLPRYPRLKRSITILDSKY